MGQSMFSSTIIPTVGRATLTAAVTSVLEQRLAHDDFEVIVVNDTGAPLPEMDWQRSARVRVLTTQRRERSVARNTGAAVARGRYFHFLDDDDLMLPGALEAFQRLSDQTDAAWLYGSYQSVDNDGQLVAEFHPDVAGNIFPLLVAGESIPFQASLLEAKSFYTAGAFDPLVCGVEDRDLGRRIALSGTVAKTPATVARIRVGQVGSTTNWARLAEDDRWCREKALRDQRALRRLWSAGSSAFLRGRLFRAYAASMVWNLRRRNLLVGASRGLSGAGLARWHVLSTDFWRGVRTQIG